MFPEAFLLHRKHPLKTLDAREDKKICIENRSAPDNERINSLCNLINEETFVVIENWIGRDSLKFRINNINTNLFIYYHSMC